MNAMSITADESIRTSEIPNVTINATYFQHYAAIFAEPGCCSPGDGRAEFKSKGGPKAASFHRMLIAN
jgi:hypothetical protein